MSDENVMAMVNAAGSEAIEPTVKATTAALAVKVAGEAAYRRGRREAIEEAARHLNEIDLPTHARTAALAIVAHEAELTKEPARGQ